MYGPAKSVQNNAMIKNILKKIFGILAILLSTFFIWQTAKTPPTQAEWQQQLSVPSTAEFNNNIVTVRNVRNFRYGPTESEMYPSYYEKTYDLNEIKRIWYISEPFNEASYAAHTFVSFEFNNGDFLAITIEARKSKDQT